MAQQQRRCILPKTARTEHNHISILQVSLMMSSATNHMAIPQLVFLLHCHISPGFLFLLWQSEWTLEHTISPCPLFFCFFFFCEPFLHYIYGLQLSGAKLCGVFSPTFYRCPFKRTNGENFYCRFQQGEEIEAWAGSAFKHVFRSMVESITMASLNTF